MSNGILVFVEHRNGVLNNTSFEAIAAAQQLGSELQQPVTAVVLGSEISTQAQGVGDCVRAKVTEGGITFTRRVFLGKLDADVVSDGQPPVFVTFQSGAYRSEQAKKGAGAPTETKEVQVGEIRMSPEPAFQVVKQAVDLTRAEIIVAIGRGIKSKENIALAEKLAEALGGDIAASRPICDAEWLPIDRQIGSSGQTVAPKLYIALGISGAIQHLVGMKNSGVIVAINKDAEAPIFDIADYGIVGDLFEAVPVLTEEIKKIKGQG